MNELALFAGAGGGILGSILLGHRIVCAVERDIYAASVLAQRQNDGILPPFPIWSDVCSFDGRPWRGIVDLVSGGFPCQDISVAGGGDGIDGEKSGLWREMFRIIREVRPGGVFVENSPALTSRGLGRVLGDLAEMGLNAEWGVLGADDAGAPHIRKRIWILAHAAGNGYGYRRKSGNISCQNGRQNGEVRPISCGSSENTAYVANPESAGFEMRGSERRTPPSLTKSHDDGCCFPDTDCERREKFDVPDLAARSGFLNRASDEGGGQLNPDWVEWLMGWPKNWSSVEPMKKEDFEEWKQKMNDGTWWTVEPNIPRVTRNTKNRADRLICLGNGQVPAVARLAFETLSRQGNR